LSGEVEQIDLDGRTVLVRQPNGGHLHRLEYDHLVIALGSATNDFGVSGVAEHALTMKTLGDAPDCQSGRSSLGRVRRLYCSALKFLLGPGIA